MDFRRLSTILIVTGLASLAGAVLWWLSFFGRLANEMKTSLTDVLPCLYQTGGTCGLVSGIAGLAGSTPYNPLLFWAGIVILVLGLAVRLSLTKPS